MSITEIGSEIIVFEGRDICHLQSPIRPPDGIQWCSIPVRDLHIEDKISDDISRSSPRIHGTSPFICLSHGISLEIISHVGLPATYDALGHCEKLRWVTLSQSDQKCIYADYSKHVTYACVGPQLSRNSKLVLDNPPFVDALPQCHWEKLVWLMKHAESSFRAFTDHCVISHRHHAKKLVPVKTYSSNGDKSSTFSSIFFGGIVFGTNVFH